MIYLHWHWLIFIPIAITLALLSVWPRRNNGGWYTPDTSGLTNLFWIIVFIVFVLIWGGLFWW